MKYAMWNPATMRMGPNDTRHVVWAIGEFFNKFLHIFYILTNVLLYIHAAIYKICDVEYILTNDLLYIQVAIYEIRDVECGDDNNGPKQC